MSSRLHAEMIVSASLPDDIDAILSLIKQRSSIQSSVEGVKQEFLVKDNQITFFTCTSQPCDADSTSLQVASIFDLSRKGIQKTIKQKRKGNEVVFVTTLIKPDKIYESAIYPTEDGEVLLFYNDDEVFLYTQVMSNSAMVQLKEWIYARKPNSREGSVYEWKFRPDLWGWPVQLEKNENSDNVDFYRYMPIYGVTFADKKERQRVVRSVKIIADQYDMYFPDKEKLAEIPPIEYWDQEGIKYRAMTAIEDTGKDAEEQKPVKGPDWRFRYSLEKNIFKVIVPAKKSQYPLLIEN